MNADRKRAQEAMRAFLTALGQADGDIEATAERVTSAYLDELLVGYSVDIPSLVRDGSEPVSDGASDPVVIDGIETATVCPHHLLVAQGRALVAYVPGDRLLGLGTVARLVDACSRRFTLQEEIAGSVTRALMEHAHAKGAFCRVVLDHACLRTRGALQSGARTITFQGAGSMEDMSQLEFVLGRKLSQI
jgi:GTP cyclohydrolase IA